MLLYIKLFLEENCTFSLVKFRLFRSLDTELDNNDCLLFSTGADNGLSSCLPCVVLPDEVVMVSLEVQAVVLVHVAIDVAAVVAVNTCCVLTAEEVGVVSVRLWMELLRRGMWMTIRSRVMGEEDTGGEALQVEEGYSARSLCPSSFPSSSPACSVEVEGKQGARQGAVKGARHIKGPASQLLSAEVKVKVGGTQH